MGCPDDDLLAAVADGCASEEDRARVEAHIDTCPECAALVADAVRHAVRDRGVEPFEEDEGELGRYDLSVEIGRGGMGKVYRAYDPRLRRDVAIKLVRPRSGSPEHETRMLREARALARLNHPNVVEVFDVGQGQRGLFIAMELVRGETLDRWLAERSRPWPEVVEVFAAAGRGLAAAHAAGLVHRDFKPSNVMIGRDDGRVRVMDFGLAHTEPTTDGALLATGDEAERLTSAGMLAGTPRYMPPEQRRGGTVDARSDQFAFCVALFEALCGELPDRDSGRPAFPDTARFPVWLRAAVARGLQPDPAERWPSMDALVARLTRARTTRRRAWWAAAAGVTVAVAGAATALPSSETCTDAAPDLRTEAVGPTLRALPETAARDVEARLTDYVQAWTAAHADACTATEGKDLRMGCLARARAELETVFDRLAGGVDEPERIAAAVEGMPDLDRCADLGALSAVAPPADAAIAAAVATARRELARSNALERLGDYDGAAARLDAIEAQVEATRYAPLRVEVDYARGWLLERRGQYEEAAAALARVHLQALAAGHDEIAAQALLRHAFVLVDRLGRGEEALSVVKRAEALVERAGGRDELRATLQRVRGAGARVLGDYDASARAFEAELEILGRTLGEDHRLYAVALSNLGVAYTRLGRYDEARKVLEGSRDIFTRIVGPDHIFVAFPLNQLGVLEEQQGNFAAAYDHVARAVEINEAGRGAEHPLVIGMLNNLGAMAYRAGDKETARRHFERVIELAERSTPQHPNIAKARGNLALMARDEGRLEEARVLWERTLVLLESNLGTDHPELGPTLTNLGELYLQLQRPDDAIDPLTRALALQTAAKGETHPDLARPLLRLAKAEHALGRRDAHNHARRAAALAPDDDTRTAARALVAP